LLFGAVRVDARSGEYAVMRVESAVDGISKAVVATVLKSQGTNPAAAFVVLAKEALPRPLSALVGSCGIFMLEVH
jgi:hypothetical protein